MPSWPPPTTRSPPDPDYESETVSNAHTSSLSSSGISIWLDDLSREKIDSGELNALIENLDVVGVTTNPTIFAGAIGGGVGYGERIADCARRGLDAESTVFELTCADVADACDVFSEVYAATGGRDGRVSIEVSPELAHDVEATVEQARELWRRIDRPGAMVKIPATEAGVRAIADVIAEGISVNVTLVFSITRYREVVNAYLTGLERARENGIDLGGIHSVASVFVSRFDTAIDPQLGDSDEAAALRGSAGIANARLVYEVYQQSLTTERARMLLAAGANPQRPLWASTGTKDPALPDTYYVTELALPGSVNTMPAATLAAFADHGAPAEFPLTDEALAALSRDADATLNAIDAAGVDYAEVTARLEAEAVEKFQASWSELLETVGSALEDSR